MICCTEEGRRHDEYLAREEQQRIEEEEFSYFWEKCTDTGANNCVATQEIVDSKCLDIRDKCANVLEVNCSQPRFISGERCKKLFDYSSLFAKKDNSAPIPLAHKAEALKELRASRYGSTTGVLK